MNLHDADINRRLTDYLERRQPPKLLANNGAAQADQINAYLRIVRKYAPEGDTLTDWWTAFLDALAENAETWAWPSERDVSTACKSAGGKSVARSNEQWKPDAVAINLGRLTRGEPLGDEWLWGECALRLVAAGADRQVMLDRRRSLARNMAELYSHDTVRSLLRDLKARHEEAQRRLDEWQRGEGDPVRRSLSIPNKKPFPADELEELVA